MADQEEQRDPLITDALDAESRKVGGKNKSQKLWRAPSRSPKPMSRGRKGLTPRERKFVEGIAEGKTDKQAATDAGFPASVSRNTKYKIWIKAPVQAHFRSMLEEILPPERIVRKMNELIDGKFVTKKQKRKLGVLGELDEGTIEEVESTNLTVSLRATQTAAAWLGLIPTKPPEITPVDLGTEEIPAAKPDDTNTELPSIGNPEAEAGNKDLDDRAAQTKEAESKENDPAVTKS